MKTVKVIKVWSASENALNSVADYLNEALMEWTYEDLESGIYSISEDEVRIVRQIIHGLTAGLK